MTSTHQIRSSTVNHQQEGQLSCLTNNTTHSLVLHCPQSALPLLNLRRPRDTKPTPSIMVTLTLHPCIIYIIIVVFNSGVCYHSIEPTEGLVDLAAGRTTNATNSNMLQGDPIAFNAKGMGAELPPFYDQPRTLVPRPTNARTCSRTTTQRPSTLTIALPVRISSFGSGKAETGNPAHRQKQQSLY